MLIEDLLNVNIPVQTLQSDWFDSAHFDVLRIDTIHPVISGNKLFKLKYYLIDTLEKDYKTIATFGGAYSNHLVATACAAHLSGLQSIGIVRGEQPEQLSPTLIEAMNYGMQLEFVPRAAYMHKQSIIDQFAKDDCYWINEGGYGLPGAKGAATIVANINNSKYTHIIAACGTGTMLAGLVQAANNGQHVIGVCVLKGYESISTSIKTLLPASSRNKSFEVFHQFHFGGYAKHPAELLQFMNDLWYRENLPTDIVYTAKLLFACKILAAEGYFPPNSSVLIIHSGGLQGNRSLTKSDLPFL